MHEASHSRQSIRKLLLAALCKALAAVHGAIALGLEGNAGFAAALCADSGEVLTGALSGLLAGVTAGLAALGLILEAALCVELLLTGGENELVAALFALQCLVLVHVLNPHFLTFALWAFVFAFSVSLNSPKVALPSGGMLGSRQFPSDPLNGVVHGFFRLSQELCDLIIGTAVKVQLKHLALHGGQGTFCGFQNFRNTLFC